MDELPESTTSLYCGLGRNGEHCETGQERNYSTMKTGEAGTEDSDIERGWSAVFVVHHPS